MRKIKMAKPLADDNKQWPMRQCPTPAPEEEEETHIETVRHELHSSGLNCIELQ